MTHRWIPLRGPRRPRPRHILPLIGSLLLAITWTGPALAIEGPAPQARVVEWEDLEIPVTVYPAEGARVLLWLPSEHGLQQSHDALARGLARRGIESWIADLYSAYFLPVGPSALESFSPEAVAALIEAIHAATKKPVVLATHDRGAIVTLGGARRWQLAHPGDDALGGAVLISPYLLEGTPEPGAAAEYRPIASATNLPLYLIQPQRSPLYWRLPALKERLAEGGSSVFTQILPGQRDRFFFRPDAAGTELAAGERLPDIMATAMKLLATQDTARQAVHTGATTESPTPKQGKPERGLAPYTGDPEPPPLALPDLSGGSRTLDQYAGRVVLVNFWASWCPPCVHEMPSMQRLENHFGGRPFDILAVNLAEEPGAVRQFVRELDLEFTVLLDAEGRAIKDWRVFAYPTSYLVDKRGRIRYALFGAIDWMQPETVSLIEALIAEEPG